VLKRIFIVHCTQTRMQRSSHNVCICRYFCCCLVQLSELRLTVERLSRDKASLRAELAGLKEELELCSFSSSKSGSE
jgi:hypothetical protein